jgi:hypothetical protein
MREYDDSLLSVSVGSNESSFSTDPFLYKDEYTKISKMERRKTRLAHSQSTASVALNDAGGNKSGSSKFIQHQVSYQARCK